MRSFVFPRRARAGGFVSIGLTGFEPNSSVPLDLHRALDCSRDAPHGTYGFATQLEPARVDATGQAIVSLKIAADDPTCWFAIETQPAAARLHVSEFKLNGTEPPTSPSASMWTTVLDEAARVESAVLSVERAPVQNLARVFGEPLRSAFRKPLTVVVMCTPIVLAQCGSRGQ